MNMKQNVESTKNNQRIALDMFYWLVNEAFEGDGHSVMGNLKNIRQEDWLALPPGGGRSIADILEHAGWCKWMYEDYAFGTASLQGDQPPLIPAGGERSRPVKELLEWLKTGHEQWIASICRLKDDRELEVERATNWGDQLPTKTIRSMNNRNLGSIRHANEKKSFKE